MPSARTTRCFPLNFLWAVLIRRSQPKEWVLDPFCGRGTTIFAGRLLGLGSIGLDSNPLAAALADAKLRSVSPRQVIATAKYVLHTHPEAHDVPSGAFWRHAYHPATLRDICRIREGLLESCDTDARIVLRAILLGALHGPASQARHELSLKPVPENLCAKTSLRIAVLEGTGV